MSSPSETLGLPQRVSLTAQVAAAVRRGIEQGTWREVIPGERRMCELFQVSRPTVRAAFRLLAKEGVLEIHHGRSNRIRRGLTPSVPATEKRLVGLVTTEPIARVSYTAF